MSNEEPMRSEIVRVKRRYASLYNQFLKSGGLIAIPSMMKIKALFEDASKSISQSERDLSEGRIELASGSVRIANSNLDAAELSINRLAHHSVI